MILDLQSISTCAELPALVQWTARKVKEANSYYPVGDFLLSLSNSDLDQLVCQVEKEDDSTICLLAMILSVSEGDELTTPEALIAAANNLELLIIMEQLARDGKIEFTRANASLADDAGNLPLANMLS